MKNLLVFTIIFSSYISQAHAMSEESLIQGLLFKKNEKWCIFVESKNAAFKKGVLTLIKIPKSYNKMLIEKSFVEIIGHQEKCASPFACFAVKKIKSAVYDPLKNK